MNPAIARGSIVFGFLSLCLTPVVSAEQQVAFHLGGYDKALFDAKRLDLEISFTLILNQILEQMGAHADFTVYDTFAEASGRFASGEIDGTFCAIDDCPDLLEFNRGLPMFGLRYGDAPTQEYVLVTSSTNGAAALAGLRGKTLAVPAGHELGLSIADHLLRDEQQQPLREFFSKLVQPDSSQTALIDLVFGKIDAAIVTRNELNIAIELNPQIAESLTTLYISPPVVLNMMVLSPKAPPERIALFNHVADNLEEYSQSRHMLQLYGADGIVRITTEDIAPTLQFLR